jgi:Gpi18-like mannosyltransferase
MKVISNKFSTISVFIVLILLALALRLFLFYSPSFDLTVIDHWYDQFIKIGRIDAYTEIFYNYPPAYLYMVGVMTLFRFIPKEQAIKLIPVVFNFLAAFAALKLVEIQYPQGSLRFVGFFIILFTPTVLFASGTWG